MMAEALDGFAALADRVRRTIFERLGGGPLAVVDLAEGLPVSRPAVSQHLKVLKDAGLVVDRAEGRRRGYRIDAAGGRAMREYLDRFGGDSAAGASRAERGEGSGDGPGG